MSNNDIQNYLPHRYPFLLIDKIIDFKKDSYLIAQKNVTINEPFFQGHFPDHPVFPGVLILEAMAQATALLDFKSNQREKDKLLYYFVGIDKARFKKPVSKKEILKSVWKYAEDADTHTVETHIYRLRKKIFDIFKNESFIVSNKNGYIINF